MIKNITAKQFWDENPDKESFYWKSSGQHTHFVLLKRERERELKYGKSEMAIAREAKVKLKQAFIDGK